MKIIKLTQGKEALVSDEDFDYLNQFSWHLNVSPTDNFYAQRSWREGKKGYGQLMQKAVAERMKLTGRLTFKDGNRLNCQRENLIPELQRGLRRSIPKSGYRGVYAGYKGKWNAQISHRQKTVHLGCFTSIDEAAKAYDKKARELFGDYAVLNFS